MSKSVSIKDKRVKTFDNIITNRQILIRIVSLVLRYPSRSLASHYVSVLYQLGLPTENIEKIRPQLNQVVKLVDELRFFTPTGPGSNDGPWNELSLQELEIIADRVSIRISVDFGGDQ